MEKVRLGFVGCGATGVMYGPVLKYLRRGVATAFMDPDRERAECLASMYGGSVYTDYEKMLEKAPIDAVVVVSPVYLHAEQTVLAAEAGKHVLCEKPMARTLSECDRMISACRDAGVVLMIGLMKRYDKSFLYAKELIEEGALGEIVAVRCDWCWNSYDGSTWRRKRMTLGSIFQDHGSHTVDLCRWWLGEIEVASGEINILVEGAEVEDQAVAVFRHEGGRLSLHYQSNMTHKPLNEYYLIDGSKASLEIQFGPAWSYTSTEPFRMILYRRGRYAEDITRYNESNLDIELQRHGRYLKELEHFCECVQEGKEPRTTGEDGRKALEAVLAVYLSSYKGQKVHLPLSEDPDLEEIFSFYLRKSFHISEPEEGR